jgi:hypothetical protein
VDDVVPGKGIAALDCDARILRIGTGPWPTLIQLDRAKG